MSKRVQAMLDEALGFDWLWEGVDVPDGHVRTYEEVLERMARQAACLRIANASAKRRGEERDAASAKAEQAERDRAAIQGELNTLQALITTACGLDAEGNPIAEGWDDEQALRYLAGRAERANRAESVPMDPGDAYLEQFFPDPAERSVVTGEVEPDPATGMPMVDAACERCSSEVCPGRDWPDQCKGEPL